MGNLALPKVMLEGAMEIRINGVLIIVNYQDIINYPKSLYSPMDSKIDELKYAAPELCIVCMEFIPTTITLPCEHVSFCTDCAQLIKKRNKKCALCRQDFEDIVSLENFKSKHKNNVLTFDKTIAPTSLINKSAYIERSNLIISRVGDNLVIRGNNVDKFVITSFISDQVIEYYLGTTVYNPNLVNTKSQYTGMTMTFRDGKITTVEGESIHTYPDFFKFVKSELVSERKLREHMLDHYYYEYVIHMSNI